MNNKQKAQEWLKRARSNLSKAMSGKSSNEILYEDLCFDVQQAVEKALKALCIYNSVVPPKTHNIEYLIEVLENNNVAVTEEIINSKILTGYAVETRYPGDYEAVDEEEYLNALEIGKTVLEWIEKITGK